MGNSNYAQGAQQHMNGNGEQAAVADDRDTLTKCKDNLPDYMIEFHSSRNVQCVAEANCDVKGRARLFEAPRLLTAAVHAILV